MFKIMETIKEVIKIDKEKLIKDKTKQIDNNQIIRK